MARIRINPLSSNERSMEHKPDETLQSIFDRFWNTLSIRDERLKEYYVIHLDGVAIDPELWGTVVPNECDVLLAIVPKGKAFLRQAIVMVAVIVATVLSQGASAPYAAAIIGGTSIAATLLVNALIPIVPPSLGGLGSNNYSQESSQTYNISGQSNQVRRYQPAPKVYGTHRVFPVVAANPYTEISADPDTGELIQMFYAIYDFGLGINNIAEVQIGDTPIGDYIDATYRLVDLNRPAADEGEWDAALNSEFIYYKGDVAQDQISAGLNKNQDDAGSVEGEYQATRTADGTGDGDAQEILLVLVAPKGLTTYGTNGKRLARSVQVKIEYSEADEDVWKSYNDPEFNYSWSSVGDISYEGRIFVMDYLPRSDAPNWMNRHDVSIITYKKVSQAEANSKGAYYWISNNDGTEGSEATYRQVDYYYEVVRGLKKGTNYFFSTSVYPVGFYVAHGDVVLGKIVSRVWRNWGGSYNGGYTYYLDTPAPYNIPFHTEYFGEDYSGPTKYELNNDRGYVINKQNPFRVEIFGSNVLTGNSTESVYFSAKFRPKTTNQVKIRVTRERSYGGYDYTIIDDLTWATMTTRFDRDPIVTEKRHTFLEIKIKATDQLNGSIQNLSGVASSVLDVWDGVEWTKEVTSNPAWVYTDLLTGEINKNALSKSRLDLDSLLEWAEYCDETPERYGDDVFFYPRFRCNFVLDYSSTLSNALNGVGNAAQASLNVNNGKYGVLIDKRKTIPVQVFTPRNSSKFTSSRTYAEVPHALKVKFVDPESEWQVKEAIAYGDGHDVTTATILEEIDTFACTNYEQAWRYGRYMLAQGLLRQENISIEVDFENLVCTRGDYVLLQHDVMKVGGTPSRVKTVDSDTNRVTFDDAFSGSVGTFAYTFRGVSGIKNGTLVLEDSNTAIFTGELPLEGDLLIVGEIDKVTINAVVKAISPSYDYKATITLVEQANEIHDAESGAPIPDYDPQFSSSDTEFAPPNPVRELTVVPVWDCEGAQYVYYLDCTWEIPESSVVDLYEIYVDNGSGFQLSGVSTATAYKHVVTTLNLDIEHFVKVIGVASSGNKLTLGEVTAVAVTPESKTTPPSDVEAAYINVLNEGLQFNWTPITDCDTGQYLIRYSSSLEAKWESSIPLQRVDRRTTMVTFQARTGTYLIKAIDWNGNESATAALARTSIPELVGLNIIDETNDFPSLLGVKDKVVEYAGGVLLQAKTFDPSPDGGVTEFWDVGYYVYRDLLDLGEIYSVRLQSLIEAEGFSDDDLISTWATLSEVDPMTTASTADWDVETQYRSTEQHITMSTWTSLSVVDPIDSGVPDAWTEWRTLTIGDFTGRVFQFRLKLVSNKASVSPRVHNGVIKADIPDRTESYNDLIAPNTGYNLVYAPSFKGPTPSPVIQITQDDAELGDYYKITNKDIDGFTITFYDATGNPVQRQFDAMVKGYGRKASEIL